MSKLVNHLMIDFETLGTAVDTKVLSLGAVFFNREEITHAQEFFFDVDSQKNRSMSMDTLSWWSKQEGQQELFSKCSSMDGSNQLLNLEYFMTVFHTLVLSHKPKRVWSNGANFDEPILANIFNSHGSKTPYFFTGVRCYRTIKSIFKIEKDMERKGKKHDALADAVFQAECLMKFFNENPDWDV